MVERRKKSEILNTKSEKNPKHELLKINKTKTCLDCFGLLSPREREPYFPTCFFNISAALRAARPRWLIRCFSEDESSAIVLPNSGR